MNRNKQKVSVNFFLLENITVQFQPIDSCHHAANCPAGKINCSGGKLSLLPFSIAHWTLAQSSHSFSSCSIYPIVCLTLVFWVFWPFTLWPFPLSFLLTSLQYLFSRLSLMSVFLNSVFFPWLIIPWQDCFQKQVWTFLFGVFWY